MILTRTNLEGFDRRGQDDQLAAAMEAGCTSLSITRESLSADHLRSVSRLQAQSKGCAGVKMARQLQGGLGGNAAALGNDFSDPSDRHMQVQCQVIDRELKRCREISSQNFAGVNGRELLSDSGIS